MRSLLAAIALVACHQSADHEQLASLRERVAVLEANASKPVERERYWYCAVLDDYSIGGCFKDIRECMNEGHREKDTNCVLAPHAWCATTSTGMYVCRYTKDVCAAFMLGDAERCTLTAP